MLNFTFLERAEWGWGCFLEDYMLLIGLVYNLKPRTILEIGTHYGLGAVVLAYAASRFYGQAQVVTVDVDQSDARSNLRLIPDIEKHIVFLEGDSSVVVPGLNQQFDLVFIDGLHTYAQAHRDWANTQRLTNTWILHDTTQFVPLQRLVQQIRVAGQYDVYQCISAPGHRRYPQMRLEQFITGMTLVQDRRNLEILSRQAHRGEDGKPLPGHVEHEVPHLPRLFG